MKKISDIKELKVAMLKYAPELASDYRDYVRSSFASMVEELGDTLKGVYNSRNWANVLRAISRCLSEVRLDNKTFRYWIDEDKLNIESIKYGEATALEWYSKTLNKLGKITDVKVTPPSGGDIVITGKVNNKPVRMEQQRIINHSAYGTMFHQFPARIKYGGKAMSEAEYKKIALRIDMLQEKKEAAKKKAIDPLSRPRIYYFDYKVDFYPRYWKPINSPTYVDQKGYTDAKQYGSARGMSEEEAWKKVLKSNKAWEGHHGDPYDPVCTAIYAWNSRPLWKKSSGEVRRVEW